MRNERQVLGEASRWLTRWLRQINRVASTFGYARIGRPELRFDLTGTDAAQAVVEPHRTLIRINSDLLFMKPERYRDEIIPHELAHIASDVWLGVGIDDHGYPWRWVMLQLGVPANPNHSLLLDR